MRHDCIVTRKTTLQSINIDIDAIMPHILKDEASREALGYVLRTGDQIVVLTNGTIEIWVQITNTS